MENLSVSINQCVIMGDLNVDLNIDDVDSRLFCDSMLGHRLFTSINICTRIFVTSATLIDNIFVMLKQNFKIHTPRALVNDVSVHCAVIVSCQLQITSTQSRGSKNTRAYFD